MLTCNTKVDQPEPNVIWSRNGQRLSDGKTLIIDKVTHNDAGVYQCLADNKVATDHKSINITIYCKYLPCFLFFLATVGNSNVGLSAECQIYRSVVKFKCSYQENVPSVFINDSVLPTLNLRKSWQLRTKKKSQTLLVARYMEVNT